MKPENWERVDSWTADLLGLPLSFLWLPGVTLGMHAGLGDHPGIVVVARGEAAHVSLPDWATDLVSGLSSRSPDELVDGSFWRAFEPTTDYRVIGPVLHTFTDEQVEAPDAVEQIPASDISHWREAVSRREWETSGFAASDVPVTFAVRAGDEVAAAANLTRFRGVPSDLGVLTHPQHRGKGYGTRVARAATAYAVRTQDIARFRIAVDDSRSNRLASTLGYKAGYQQLVVIPP